MTTSLAFSSAGARKWTLAVAITVGLLLVALIGIRYASAVAPSDYGLKEGDTVSAAGSDDPDVYIINDWGYKRLFLNPVIFGFYGHLGGFAAVHSITPATRDAFPTSGLFRNCETNDEKVYGVETTGEDTGVLHWVNTTGAQAVADDPNFFKKVFCINSNEFNWYAKGSNYTSVSQVPSYVRVPGVPGVPGAVTASLASDTPGAASLTRTATGVTYLKVNLSGTGTVSSVRIVRKGPGATADFGNVYLYDGATRLTSGRTPSSSDSSITYSGLNLAVSGSKTLSVVADMVSTGATAGNVNYFTVEKVADVTLASGTVGGSFPISGSNFTVTGQTGGSVSVIKSGSLANPNVGSSNAEISEFKITANTEAAKIQRLTLINAGTIKYDQLTNLKLVVSGTTVATGVSTSGGYAIFDFGSSPYVIAKGDNRVFGMYADIGTGAKKAETINFYFEVSADVYAVGDQFGFGMLPSFDSTTGMNGSGSTKAHSLTLQGGVLTLSFIGPSATNVGTSTTKTHLLDFDISSIANLEVRKTDIVLCHAINGSTYDDISNATSASVGFIDLNNVSVVDRDTGTAYVGPQDGTAFTTATTSGTSASPYYTGNECATGKRGLAKLFTDVFTMNAGETKHLAIVADVKTANTGTTGGVSFASGDQFKAVLYNYGTIVGTAGDLTVLKYVGTNTGPYSVDVVPSSNLSGNSMTIQGSTLTLALAANPTAGNHNYVKGTSKVNAAGFSFSAALGNDVKITAVTLQGYADSTAAGGVTTGNPGQLISAIRLVDGDTGAQVAAGPSTNNLSLTAGTGAGQAVFSNLTWTIPGGATKTLLAQVDLATNAAPTNNIFSFDINATTDVTALDASSNTINLANRRVNGNGAATTYVTYNDAGTLAVAAAADNPTATAMYWGQTGAVFSKFKFTSTNEGFYIERLNLYDSAGSTTNIPNNIKSVSLTYTNKAGNSVTSVGQSFNSQASTSFAFSGDARPYVPKDGSLYVTVTANITPAADFFRADGANFSIDLSVNPNSIATTNDEFRALGEGSGTVKGTALTDLVGSTTKVDASNMYVYRSFPQFTYVSTPATTIAVGQDVFKFSITAMGLAADGATVFFDGTTIASPSLTVIEAASGSMRFAVIASGESANALGLELRRVVDSSGASVDQLVASASGAVTDYHYLIQNLNNLTGLATGNVGSASFRFKDVAANQSIEIPAGSSNTFVLRLKTVTGYAKPYNSSSGRAADYVQIIMKTDQNSLATWTDNGGANRNSSASSKASILKSLPMNGTRINFQ